jgi:hypothetical protein
MLYTLKNVFDSEGILLKFMGAYTKDNKSRYKSALLKFWVALNSMDFNMAELKMQKMLNYSITDVKNNNRQV